MLKLKDSLEYVSELLDVRANAVILSYGEAAIDVDKPEDHELVTKQLQNAASFSTQQQGASPAVNPLENRLHTIQYHPQAGS